ncbi:M1 family metallopeptidase [Aegicerativicinus sediminis]|uniref:M1 family metallopeptidase n=1 Tax=Aegicerativicinus sediminis TaxID=2893202 RepID=UPI001E516D94|nr:M1 family metallopeptidase [Aegicerativicinus sediminis]
MKVFTFFILISLTGIIGHAQEFSRQDTLRGSITPEREWWDLSYYNLDIVVDIEKHAINGSNTIRYKVLKPNKLIQIDLQPPMEVFKITQDGVELNYKQEGNAYFVELEKDQAVGNYNEIIVHYGGIPRIAPRPPWDSGLVWKKDELGKDFISSISWGAGSSQWWPCKDHMYDEPDSIKFSINVPKNLVAVANGKLMGKDEKDNSTHTFHWKVSNPINNYGITFNIGNYVNFSEIYNGENGPLTCEYYVLEQNLDKAKVQFKQVPLMLEAFEYWFGPYPFYEDGYKLIEAPYLGMEHQGAITYGNKYQNGYLGSDRTNTGWGKKFDYLIIHESGHEWFANNITFKDIADIWIHESFTTYSEGLFVEYYYGKEAGNDYQIGKRGGISNDKPMIGNYQVNDINYTGDNYPKGSTILHMLRQIVNDDNKWRQVLRGLGDQFYHQTVTTEQIENYIAKETQLDLNSFWNQYLRTTQLPQLEYNFSNGQLSYRWSNAIDNFKMPLKVTFNGKERWINPTSEWQQMDVGSDELILKIDPNFYVTSTYSNSKQ